MDDSPASSSGEHQPVAPAAVATATASPSGSPKPPASGPLRSNTSSVNTSPAQPQYGDPRSSSVMSSSRANGPPATMNMGEMRAALPASGLQAQQPYLRHGQHLQHQHHHHVQAQFAVPSPAMFYPVPYAPFYPQYFAHHQQPSYPTFSPAFMQPPSSSHPVPMYAQTTAGYGAGYLPTPYPMVVGQRQGPSTIPQGYAQSGPQVGKQPARARPSAASPDDGSMTIVDGSASMKSGSEPRPPLPADCEKVSPASVTTTTTTTPGAPRRTPKQSGHALWVGNLPPGASIVELKDHFSQGMCDDIESVFLISKSNCAFINYKTEAACSAAQARFHDSRFQGVRLVCRLRRGVVPSGSPPSGGRGASGSPVKGEGYDSPSKTSASEKSASDAGDLEHEQQLSSSLDRVPNRYFIVKSLTIDDLEASSQSGIWATQTHNEVNLNRAYDTADNVYLIFSANKSGEYYGYARMVSPIQEDQKLALEMPPRTNHIQLLNTSETAEPNVTVTPASATARSGRIIDDHARGTIFWEADTTEEEEDNAAAGSRASLTDGEDSTGDVTPTSATTTTTTTTTTQSQTIGRPFRIQWLSTERVPFHRTRGLRNPWNANRGVKIARDGTEIEPSVGAQVVELFHIPNSATMAYRVPN